MYLKFPTKYSQEGELFPLKLETVMAANVNLSRVQLDPCESLTVPVMRGTFPPVRRRRQTAPAGATIPCKRMFS